MANEVMFNLKYGIFSRLPEAKTPGTVYVTADEKAMYVDLPQVTTDTGTVAADRIRISQIIIKDSVRDVQPPFSPDAFYYFVEENALLKWIPAKGETPAAWKQINSVSDVTTNLEALERRVGANETAITGLTTRIGNAEEAIGDNTKGLTKAVADNKAAIGAPSAEGQAATGLHADIEQLQTDLGTANTNITANTNAIGDSTKGLTKGVADNASAISGLRTDKLDASVYNTKVAEIDGKFTTIDNTIGVPAADGQAATGLHADIAANETAIAGLTTTIGNDSSGLIKDVRTNASAIGDLTTRTGNAETDINNLETLIGALPEGTAQNNVVDFVIAQMEAADAMLYKGGIGAYTNLPTTGVEAGHTYVITADFTYGGESYYAGDLVVAAADQGTAETYAGGWTHVKTGYQANQEAKLTGTANAIKLTSYTGVDLGTVNIVAKEGSALTATMADNTLTLGIQWGSF